MSFKKLTVLASFLALGLPLSAPALANPQSPATVPTLGAEPRSQFPNPNPVYERFQGPTSPAERLPSEMATPFQPLPSDEVVPSTDTPPMHLDEIEPPSETGAFSQPLPRQETEPPSSDES
jgi:hypothetical protein